MTVAALQAPETGPLVVFDGQSHNLLPTVHDITGGTYLDALIGAGLNFPDRIMTDRGYRWTNVSVGGVSWTTLAVDAATRLHPLGADTGPTVLVMNGGSSDIWDGDTGAQVYADMVDYAADARTAGFDAVIAVTIPGNAANTAGQDAARVTANELILADASGAFDATVDLDVTALADWTDESYYFGDHIHWVNAGAALAAAAAGPVLDAVIDALTG